MTMQVFDVEIAYHVPVVAESREAAEKLVLSRRVLRDILTADYEPEARATPVPTRERLPDGTPVESVYEGELPWITPAAELLQASLAWTVEEWQDRLEARAADDEKVARAEAEKAARDLAAQVPLPLVTAVEWAHAGGRDECPHGYAAGVPCPRCAAIGLVTP